MRCKRHISDLTSTIGVCATCLRERLLSIIAAQSSSSSSSQQQQQQQQHRSRNHVHSQVLAAAPSSLDQHRKSDFDRSLKLKSDLQLESLQSERIVFPRSVSPYVLRGGKLCEDGDVEEVVVPDRRFYSTPQIGQMISDRERKHSHGHGHGHGRFSFLSGWFRPRSDRSEFDFKPPLETKCSTSSSFSWFSSIRWKHKSKPPKTSTISERLPRRIVMMDRGMTPERMSCVDADEFDHELSSRMEFSSDSCKRTPARSVKPSTNLSGMAFCMSPLVRASPARLWNQKCAAAPSDLINFSGEIQSVNHPHLSIASAYCANRSRKLVDFGRASHRH